MAQVINDRDQVAGILMPKGAMRASVFLWERGQMRLLKAQDTGKNYHGDQPSVNAINSQGDLVGVADHYGFLYHNGKMQRLLPPGAAHSVAYDINDNGQVVGVWGARGIVDESQFHGFLYHNGKFKDLGAGRSLYSINNKGEMVGVCYPKPDKSGTAWTTACLYRNGKWIDDLGTLASADSRAYAVTDQGDVLGTSRIFPLHENGEGVAGYFEYTSFLWRAGTMRPLQEVQQQEGRTYVFRSDPNYASSYPDVYANNQKGEIVNVNSLLPATSRWRALRVTAQNRRRQIVGAGMLEGNQSAFLLTPQATELRHPTPQIALTPNGHDADPYAAVQAGNIEQVQLLLATGADPDVKGSFGPHLLTAAQAGRADIVSALLNKGADVNARSDDGQTALMRAKNSDVVKVLLAHSARLDLHESRSGFSAVMVASPTTLLLLLAKGADINDRNRYGETALHRAAIDNDAERIHILLVHGAKVNVKDNYGRTPITRCDNLECMRLLLKAGATSEGVFDRGRSPLMRAAIAGKLDVVTLLLTSGAKPDQRNIEARTALSFAAQEGHIDVMRTLLARGAKANQKGVGGLTPLMYTAWFGHLEAAKLLLQHEANVNAKDDHGKTAQQWATEHGHQEVVHLIMRAEGKERKPQ